MKIIHLILLGFLISTVGCVNRPPNGYINYIRNMQPPDYSEYTDEELVYILVGPPPPPEFYAEIIAEDKAKKESGEYEEYPKYAIGGQPSANW